MAKFVTSYLLRLLIAFDQLAQCAWRYGIPGLTMSARIGTAAAHGHRWGLVMFWLLDRTWPFGKDATGQSHCVGAMRNDVLRARAVIQAVLDDDVVVERFQLHDLKQ